MNDEQRVAVERLRNHSIDMAMDDSFWRAFFIAKDLLLAEHPADDEPVTEEWLRSVGGVNHHAEVGVWLEHTVGVNECGTVCVCNGRKDGATRGDVRRLCRALGIPLNG